MAKQRKYPVVYAYEAGGETGARRRYVLFYELPPPRLGCVVGLDGSA